MKEGEKWCFNSFNNWASAILSVPWSVCSPEGGAFSTPKDVGTIVKLSIHFTLILCKKLVKIHVLVIARIRNGQF